MRVKLCASTFTLLALFACGSSGDDPTGREQNDQNSESVPIMSTTTLGTPTSTTAVPESPETSANFDNKDEPEFGAGGLVADLEAWADRDLPLFITASHIDVSDIERISLFRSNAGHDYSDSFESCCSMKHYYRPFNYYEKRFTQPIFSPVDGVILYIGVDENSGEASWLRDYKEATGKQPPDDYLDTKVFIRPDTAPNLWIRLHHVSPLEEILAAVAPSSGMDQMFGTATPASPGFRVNAGDNIGVGLGEISIERHLSGNGIPSPCTSAETQNQWGQLPGCKAERQFHSIFEFMTDDVFNDYAELTDVERNDFIISATERSLSPLRCDGEKFETRDIGGYLQLQEGETSAPTTSAPVQQKSGESLPSAETLAQQKPIIASVQGEGSSESQRFETAAGFSLIIASDGGPLEIEVNTGEGPRVIYNRPPGDGISTYESDTFVTSEVSITIDAASSVSWKLVIVAP
ncbi:MAG: hypothetical protein VX846_03995 [Actinomycetota bacterium]|nr:hypothetical protein [Actinomycetota bacterium]